MIKKMIKKLLNLKIHIQVSVLMDQICEDCSYTSTDNSLFVDVPCCTDYHCYGISCCSKVVCKDFCRFKCLYCEKINRLYRLSIEEHEEYVKCYICYNCNNENEIKITYNGDLKEECHRYCG